MMNYPYESNFIPAYPVRVACQIMLNAANRLTGLAQAAGKLCTIVLGTWILLALKLLLCVGVFYNSTGQLSCFNNTKEYVECADPTGCGGGPTAQAWDYQVTS